MNRYLPIKKSTAHNLLSGEPEKVPKNEPIQYGSYWNDHLYLQLVDMHDSFKPGSIPPHILPHLKFDATNTTYYPVLFFNEFWLLREKLLLLNDTVKELPITIEFSVLSPMKWMFYSQMDASFKLQESLGAVAEDEKDEIKRMLLETNPVLLGTTILVSLLHSIFEFLAFKNGKPDLIKLTLQRYPVLERKEIYGRNVSPYTVHERYLPGDYLLVSFR